MPVINGDIKLAWDLELMQGDINFEKGEFEIDSGLETAVIISLFTDRRAYDDDELPDPNEDNRRGWYGDLVSPDVEGDRIGSRLWLLERSKITQKVLRLAEEYASESLQWMIVDGVIIKVIVTAERIGTVGNEWLGLKVELYKSDGVKVALKYDIKWTSQINS